MTGWSKRGMAASVWRGRAGEKRMLKTRRLARSTDQRQRNSENILTMLVVLTLVNMHPNNLRRLVVLCFTWPITRHHKTLQVVVYFMPDCPQAGQSPLAIPASQLAIVAQAGNSLSLRRIS
jgi:hypothetical protein